MKLHEYQAKAIFAEEGVAVPPGFAAESVAEAVEAAEKLGGNFWVVKAMVHAGGRGKGRFQGVATQEELEKVVQGIPVEGGVGGVALCKSIDDVRSAAEADAGKCFGHEANWSRWCKSQHDLRDCRCRIRT